MKQKHLCYFPESKFQTEWKHLTLLATMLGSFTNLHSQPGAWVTVSQLENICLTTVWKEMKCGCYWPRSKDGASLISKLRSILFPWQTVFLPRLCFFSVSLVYLQQHLHPRRNKHTDGQFKSRIFKAIEERREWVLSGLRELIEAGKCEVIEYKCAPVKRKQKTQT